MSFYRTAECETFLFFCECSDRSLQGHEDCGERGDQPAVQRKDLLPGPLGDLQRRRHQQQLLQAGPHHVGAGLQHSVCGRSLITTECRLTEKKNIPPKNYVFDGTPFHEKNT